MKEKYIYLDDSIGIYGASLLGIVSRAINTCECARTNTTLLIYFTWSNLNKKIHGCFSLNEYGDPKFKCINLNGMSLTTGEKLTFQLFLFECFDLKLERYHTSSGNAELSEFFTVFHNPHFLTIKIVIVRLKSILLNCSNILLREMFF